MTDFLIGIGLIVGAPILGLVGAYVTAIPLVGVAYLYVRRAPADKRNVRRDDVKKEIAAFVWLAFVLVTLAVGIKGFWLIL